MASIFYNSAKKSVIDGTIVLLSDTIKMMLVNNSYVPDPDHEFVSTITNATSKELSGTGYVSGFGGAGRQALTSKAINKNNAGDRAEFTAGNVTWSGINAGTIHFVVLIKEVTNDAASLLIACLEFPGGVDLPTIGGDVVVKPETFSPSGAGYFKLT